MQTWRVCLLGFGARGSGADWCASLPSLSRDLGTFGARVIGVIVTAVLVQVTVLLLVYSRQCCNPRSEHAGTGSSAGVEAALSRWDVAALSGAVLLVACGLKVRQFGCNRPCVLGPVFGAGMWGPWCRVCAVLPASIGSISCGFMPSGVAVLLVLGPDFGIRGLFGMGLMVPG